MLPNNLLGFGHTPSIVDIKLGSVKDESIVVSLPKKKKKSVTNKWSWDYVTMKNLNVFLDRVDTVGEKNKSCEKEIVVQLNCCTLP